MFRISQFWMIVHNKFIMEVKRERNIYLRRIFASEPHTYSYDIETGKYSLINKEGHQYEISPYGVLKSKFRPNISGCANHKSREKYCNEDPSILHYTPDAKLTNRYRNIMPKKLTGYAQYPYQLQQSPIYLRQRKNRSFVAESHRNRRSITQRSEKDKQRTEQSSILDYSVKKSCHQPVLRKAWESIASSRPSPNENRKNCYNNKCRFLRQLGLQKIISERQKRMNPQHIKKQTLGKSFHEEVLKLEKEQEQRLTIIKRNTLKKLIFS